MHDREIIECADIYNDELQKRGRIIFEAIDYLKQNGIKVVDLDELGELVDAFIDRLRTKPNDLVNNYKFAEKSEDVTRTLYNYLDVFMKRKIAKQQSKAYTDEPKGMSPLESSFK